MNGPVPAPGILDIQAYAPGAASFPGAISPLRLASNEAALGPSPVAIAAAEREVRCAHRYPDPSCADLRSAIAARYGQPPASIVCGGGSDSLIYLVMRAFVTVGDEVIAPLRAFSMGRIAALSCGAKVVAVEEGDDLEMDVDSILAALGPRTKAIYIANPNNPTGRMIPAAEIRRLHRELPSHVLLMLDAAYRDYVTASDYAPGDELVREGHANVVVFSTFSKSYALAGLRVGWLFASPEIVGVVNRIKPAFAVSSPAIAAAIAALDDRAHFEAEVALTVELRQTAARDLRALGYAVSEPHGNFVLVEIPPSMGTAAALNEYLISRAILVRPVANYALPQALRVTIGTEAEMTRVVDSFAEAARDTLRLSMHHRSV